MGDFSADMRTLAPKNPDCMKMLQNQEILAINQDPAANAPRLIFRQNTTVPGRHPYPITAQGFSRKLHDGSVALLLLNRDDDLRNRATLGATWEDLGLPSGASCTIRDLMAQQDIEPATGNFSASV